MSDYKYFKSNDISVYPSGFRNDSILEKVKTSTLMTEDNLTSLGNKISSNWKNNRFLIIDPLDTNYYILGIDGYIFKFSKSVLEGIILTKPKFSVAYFVLNIKQNDSYIGKILHSINGDDSLDEQIDDNPNSDYYFKGLAITDDITDLSTDYITFKIYENETILEQPLRLNASEIRDNKSEKSITDEFNITTLKATNGTITNLTSNNLNQININYDKDVDALSIKSVKGINDILIHDDTSIETFNALKIGEEETQGTGTVSLHLNGKGNATVSIPAGTGNEVTLINGVYTDSCTTANSTGPEENKLLKITKVEPNNVLIGPASGSKGVPDWRKLNASDLPDGLIPGGVQHLLDNTTEKPVVKGNTNNPVYFKQGKPAECTNYLYNNVPVDVSYIKLNPFEQTTQGSITYSSCNGTLQSSPDGKPGYGTYGSYILDIPQLGTKGDPTFNSLTLNKSLTVSSGTNNTANFNCPVTIGDKKSTKDLTVNGNITCTNQIQGNTFYATSDKRLKENIKNYTCEKSILDLDVKKFDFINGNKDQIGCIAQDLREICPEIVKEDQNGYLSIQENKLVYLLLNEVKQLKKEIEELKNNK